jgi:hypothetical protein
MNNRFILAFAGTLSESQDLMPVIRATQHPDLRNVAEIRVVGTVNEVFYEQIQKGYFDIMIAIINHMPYERLMKYLGNADILIHPMPKMSYPAIGAKFWDYMTLGKQILALEYQENKELQQILAESGRGKVLRYENQASIDRFILDRYEFAKV